MDLRFFGNLINWLSPMELNALMLSLKVAMWAMLSCVPFGLGLAWVLSRKNFFGKSLVDGVLHLPLVLPPVVIGYILLVVLGRNGFIGKFLLEHFNFSIAFTWKGAAVASALMAFPLFVRSVRISLDAVDSKLEEVAKTLGASNFKIFFTVTLPLILPGIISGLILAFARSLGEFGATITFVSNIPAQTQTLPLALYTLTQMPNGEDGAFRLCIISICIALMALITANFLEKKFFAWIKG